MVVFRAGDEGCHTYRIPAVAAADGSVLAFAEARRHGAGDAGEISLVVRSSRDSGRSWGPIRTVAAAAGGTVGNPVPFVLGGGRVVVLCTLAAADADERAVLAGRGERRIGVVASADGGETWSAPRDITGAVRKGGWRWYATGPGHGAVLPDGRLVAPANHSTADRGYAAHLLISEDAGISWRIGAVQDDPAGDGVHGNETSLAAVGGRLYVNSRNQQRDPAATRAAAWSEDGGETLAAPLAAAPELDVPVCQGSVLAPAGGGLLLSAPTGRRRHGLRVRRLDAAGTSAVSSVPVWDGPAAYSDLVDLGGGTVGVLFEAGADGPYETVRWAVVRPGEDY